MLPNLPNRRTRGLAGIGRTAMELSQIAAFWGVSILFILTPGADWAYAISAGLGHRITTGVTGLLLGHLMATLVVAAGVGALVAQVPAILTALTIGGALYLMWLGVQTIRHPSTPVSGGEIAAGSAWGWVGRGWGVSGMNPKVLLLFLALLPQFTSLSSEWPVGGQILALGAVHLISCAAVYLAVALTARIVLGTRPTLARGVSRVSGVLMAVIGGSLIVQLAVAG